MFSDVHDILADKYEAPIMTVPTPLELQMAQQLKEQMHQIDEMKRMMKPLLEAAEKAQKEEEKKAAEMAKKEIEEWLAEIAKKEVEEKEAEEKEKKEAEKRAKKEAEEKEILHKAEHLRKNAEFKQRIGSDLREHGFYPFTSGVEKNVYGEVVGPYPIELTPFVSKTIAGREHLWYAPIISFEMIVPHRVVRAPLGGYMGVLVPTAGTPDNRICRTFSPRYDYILIQDEEPQLKPLMEAELERKAEAEARNTQRIRNAYSNLQRQGIDVILPDRELLSTMDESLRLLMEQQYILVKQYCMACEDKQTQRQIVYKIEKTVDQLRSKGCEVAVDRKKA